MRRRLTHGQTHLLLAIVLAAALVLSAGVGALTFMTIGDAHASRLSTTAAPASA